MKMKHILLMFMLILLNHKERNWSKVRKHSNVIMYVTVMNVVYYVLCRRKLVWDFRDNYFSKKFIRFVNTVGITPLFILLFLSKMPNENQIQYIFQWATGSIILEWIALKQNMITYRYGWTLSWTWLLYMKMYLYSYFYSKKPFLVHIMTIISTMFFGAVFKISFVLKIQSAFKKLLSLNISLVK